MTDSTVTNRSLLSFWVDSTMRRQIYSHHVAIMGDNRQLTLLAEEQTSLPLYRNLLNSADENGYPITVFDMDRIPNTNRPDVVDRVKRVQLYDSANALMWNLSREQCFDKKTGTCSFVLSYVRGKDGSVAPFILPTHLADKVLRFDRSKIDGVEYDAYRQPTYGSHTLDSTVPGHEDYELIRGAMREPSKQAPIYASVRHAVADAVVGLRADMEDLRSEITRGLMAVQIAQSDALAAYRISRMPEGTTAANLELPPRVDPRNDWVVEDRFALRG